MTRLSAAIAYTMAACIALATAAGSPEDQQEMPAGNSIACTACHSEPDSSHKRSFEGWLESGHSRSLKRVEGNAKASADCLSCHSDEGFKAKLQGKKVDFAQKESYSPIICTTCHNPHQSKNPFQLVTEDSETLCTSCHQQRNVLKGIGARNLEEARSFHSAVDCVSCHMPDRDHRMKLIRPDDPTLTDKRQDTCTACHKDNNRKARATQIQSWQDSYKKEMAPLQEDLKLINAALKQKPDQLSPALKTKLSDVEFNLAILVNDRSEGVHNHDFATFIMTAASKDLAEIKKAMSLK